MLCRSLPLLLIPVSVDHLQNGWTKVVGSLFCNATTVEQVLLRLWEFVDYLVQCGVVKDAVWRDFESLGKKRAKSTKGFTQVATVFEDNLVLFHLLLELMSKLGLQD